MKRVLLFDTETTALIRNSLLAGDKQPKVIEFYGQIVDPDSGAVLRELEFLCNPGIKLPGEVKKITGLTDDDLKDMRPFSEWASEVVDLLNDADTVVAHNLAYDYFVLDNELQRCGHTAYRWPTRRICTVQETEWIKGHRMKLMDLYQHLFGEPFKDAHRARADVEALTRCFLELYKRGWV